MTESILDSVKELNGIVAECTDFDSQIAMHTNSVLFSLNQIGIGNKGFRVTGNSETWGDFLKADEVDVDAVKTYTALKVRLLFDVDGMTSGVIAAIENNLKELEWRIYVRTNTEVYNE